MVKKRVHTGIDVFDKISLGGFIENSVNLIGGSAGSGKSTFGLQFLWNGLTMYKERGIYFSLEEDLDEIRGDALEYGWDFFKYEKSKDFIFYYLKSFEQNIVSNKKVYLNEIVKLVKKNKVKRVVLDPITLFEMAFKSDYDVRVNLFELICSLKKINCALLLISEIPGGTSLDVSAGEKYSRFGIEEFVADSVVVLYSSGLGGVSDRALRIVKMRRTNHVRGPIPMAITNKGIKLTLK